MLVITGTQRSGTSMIAMLLRESGYSLHSQLEDEVGFGECEAISAFYREYLGDPTFPFDDFNLPLYAAPHYLPTMFQRLNFQVVKFSFLLMNPAFVMIWHKFRPAGDTFLVMCREAHHVVLSKRRGWHRFEHDSTLLQQQSVQLKYNFLQSLGLLMDNCYQVAQLEFPKCVDEGLDPINRALVSLDPEVQITSSAWDRVVDPTKVHFR